MKLSECTKFGVLFIICTVFLCPLADGKKAAQNKKDKPAPVATPFEIDEEFKGEFVYFDAKEEKLKLKEEKKNLKVEKKHQKLLKKKKKLEQKKQKSTLNVQKYTDYKEKLENSFLPNETSE